MASVTFDTLKFVKKLEESGIPDKQAEAIADAFKDAQGEAELATKADLQDVKNEIELLRRDMDARFIQMEQRMTIKLGALMVVAVGSVATLVKLL